MQFESKNKNTTNSFNKSLNEEVNKIAQLLKIKGFNTTSEVEYDNVLESWIRHAEGHGFEKELLKYIIFRVGTEEIQEIIRDTGLLQGTLDELINTIARTLFEYDSCLDSIEKWLNAERVEKTLMDNVTELLKRYNKWIYRYEILCIRWRHPNVMHEEKKKKNLIFKLRPKIRQPVAALDWKLMDYKELTRTITRIYHSMRGE